MSIAQNIARIRQQMDRAAIAAGRDPKSILLCAATKMNDAEAVREAIRGGVDCCGENRVQELTAKLAEHAYDGAPVHFIGHLQTNKVRQVVIQNILLEINIGAEESKTGFAPEDIHPLLEKIGQFPNVRVKGLMAIPPVRQKDGDNDKFFLKMYNISVDIIRKK